MTYCGQLSHSVTAGIKSFAGLADGLQTKWRRIDIVIFMEENFYRLLVAVLWHTLNSYFLSIHHPPKKCSSCFCDLGLWHCFWSRFTDLKGHWAISTCVLQFLLGGAPIDPPPGDKWPLCKRARENGVKWSLDWMAVQIWLSTFGLYYYSQRLCFNKNCTFVA